MNSKTVEKIYSRNYGTTNYYKRSYCENLNYTDGIMDFQTTLGAFWFVDMVIGCLPEIIKVWEKTGDTFYVISIKIDNDKNGTVEIYREGYVNGKYNEHITLIKLTIPNIDLPQYDYKFYLIQSSPAPLIFTLLLTGEY